MREITLQAQLRTQFGKQSRAIRREGNVPGVFYVHGEPNIPITVSEKGLKPLIFTSETHVINLQIDGAGRSCILRDMQFDPLSDRPLHFDLQGLKEDEEITLEVPIVVTGGTPVGVRDGGIVQQIIHRLRISCLPKNIPDQIEVNAENLKINQFVHVSELKLDNVTVLENETSSIVGVVPPTVEKEPVAAEAVEETTEPEVIGKGKKVDEEGAEGAAAGDKKADAAGAKTAAAKPAAAPAKEEKK
jgi:large subunit ribosomal protein L25